MFSHFSEINHSEAQYKREQFQEIARQERLAHQATSGRAAKRNKLADVLMGVKRGRLSIEEGLNLLENV